jgi:hypothetical protein
LNDDAERNVRYILDRPRPNLSRYGFYVANNVLSRVAENKEQWKDAFALQKRGLDYGPNFDDDRDTASAALRHTYLASRLKDLAIFRQARDFATSIGGKAFPRWAAYVDALEAMVLASTDHKSEARELVARWSRTPDWQRVFDYWAVEHPECAVNWKSLADR